MKKLNVCITTAFRLLTLIQNQMKAMTKTFVLFMAFNLVAWIVPQKISAQVSVSIDFQVFYDDLSPYGNWVDNSDYGYVWIPDVSRGFTPYGTNGYWVFTDEGWTWVSNYSWGWAPFHYGRWFYDRYYGWLWVPDNEWGPGWVTWRRSEGYYGWAPIGPGISIDFAYSSGYSLPYNQWTFVRDRDFGRTNIYNYYVSSSNYTTIINNSTVINNIYTGSASNVRYNTGPDRNDVERSVGKTFSPITIRESSRHNQSVSGDQLQTYRPRVQKNISAERKPAPSKVEGWKGNQPTREQPVKQQPTREQPVKQQPTREQPVRQQPTREQPVRQQPTREQPVRQQPTREQPVRQQPTKQQPTREQPGKQQPTKQPAQQKQDTTKKRKG